MPNEQNGNLSPQLCRKVLRVCGSFNLRKASRSVSQLYDDILLPTGLRSTQVAILATLAVEQEFSVTRLARELVLSPSTLSRNLRPLERDGLVDTHNAGRRGKSVRLTADGKRALLHAVPYWQKAQDKFIALVGAADWKELTERLAKTVTATRS